MRTIFITIFQGAEAKNILRTDIYNNLIADGNTRIVFFVDSPERAEYYKKEFSHPRVVYEVAALVPAYGLDAAFSSLSFSLLKTATTDLRRRMALETSQANFRYITGLFFNRLLARPWVRKAVRWLDYRLIKRNIFGPYFDKYNPSVIFLAHLFDDREISLLREAKRRGIRTIGFINSWDKLTARHSVRLLPDSLVVFNKIVEKEAVDHVDMEKKDIFVSGVPQYDWHINYKPVSRADFCVKNKLDPDKKIIVYAPMGKAFSDSDWDIIDLLNNSITQNLITNAQLFVRFQPNDFTDPDELEKRPWLRYALPGVRFSRERGVNWDMNFDDIKGLTDTLANADLFICYASSVSVEAAIFDVPVININFEVKNKQLLSQTPTFFYQTEHYGKVVRSGAIRYPKSKDEFIGWINKYLEHPEIDREARGRLVEAQCGEMDGQSGKRISDFILSKLS